MYKSPLLYKIRPLTINPELAIAVGLNEAIVLQQVQYWCEHNEEAGKNYRDGYFWVYNSFPEWQKQFPWWCERTVKTIFSRLEKQNLLIAANYNRLAMDRTKWYRINHEALDAIAASPSGKNCPMDSAELARPIPETKTNNDNGVFTPQAAENTLDHFSDMGVDGIDIPSFIQRYYELYEEEKGKPHPRLKAQQVQRVTEELADFLNDPEFCGIDADGLQAMARDFFDRVDTDGNINHFATRGILENRFWDVYSHGYGG